MWYQLGPDFIYALRTSRPSLRLSRRNEYGLGCSVAGIAVDPMDAPTIYTLEVVPIPPVAINGAMTMSHSGTSAWRTRDDGQTWTCITDELYARWPGLDPQLIAIHPRRTT